VCVCVCVCVCVVREGDLLRTEKSKRSRQFRTRLAGMNTKEKGPVVSYSREEGSRAREKRAKRNQSSSVCKKDKAAFLRVQLLKERRHGDRQPSVIDDD